MTAKGSVSEFVGWVLVLVGALLAVSAGRQVADFVSDGEQWVATNATVVRTRVIKANPTIQAGKGVRSNGESLRVYHDLVYFREGSRYQESVELGMFPSPEEANSAIGSLARPGAQLRVWVNASNPRDVRLNPQSSRIGGWGVWLFLLMGLGALQGGWRMIGISAGPAVRLRERPVAAA